jgi:hypothetical protein
MKRVQFLEIEDQSWCPAVIRDGITDYLQFTINAAQAYKPIADRLANVIRSSATPNVIDLCSGGGGPWISLSRTLNESNTSVHVTLTDWQPNVAAFTRVTALTKDAITFHSTPVDARRVPRELRGTRTLFTSFHHFSPDDARAVLRDAAQSGSTIAVFEATQRSVVAVLVTLLSPLIVLLATPTVRPFRWSRLFWTYLVPVIPLAVMFDGVVSCLRTYTPEELIALTEGIEGSRWEAGEQRAKGPVPVTYLVGTPLPNNSLS